MPTCPFRNFKHIQEAFKIVGKSKADGVISLTEYEFPHNLNVKIKKNFIEPSHSLISGNTRSQDQKIIYRPNGGTWAGYLTTRSGYADSYNRRKGWNDAVRGIVESAGWTFIDPYDHMLLAVPIEYDGSVYSSGYECNQCDGIHLTSSAASDYVSKISGYL